MLTKEESEDLMKQLIDLRSVYETSKSSKDLLKLKKHENICMEKFKYLVLMRTAKYKKFSNYEDLNQEGFYALLESMKNYNPKRGIFFWWAHKYIDTRIFRSANSHSTIKFPLHIAKNNAPHKESFMPNIIEETFCPDKEMEKNEIFQIITDSLKHLNDNQRAIIDLFYGLTSDKKMPINDICKKLNISRSYCLKQIKNSLKLMREKAKI